MNRGIVMEVSAKKVVVMTPDGRFEKVPAAKRGCQIGEEIVFAPRSVGFRNPALAAASTFAAAAVLCIVLLATLPNALADKSVVAYVSIDINPSVEVGVDSRRTVREINGLNPEGAALIQGLEAQGEELDVFTEKLLQKAEEQKYLQKEGDIIIASTVVNEQGKLDDSLLSEHMKQTVLTHIIKEHPDQPVNVQVTALVAPKEVREEAKKSGVSTGKYSVYLNAKNSGFELKIDDLKTDSVHNIAKEAGGINKLAPDAGKMGKEALKQLLEEEKNGTLDKKVQEKKKKEDAAKNPSPKPSVKPGTLTPKPSATPAPKPGTPSVKPVAKPSNDGKAQDTRKSGDRDDEKKSGDKATDDRKNNSRDDDGKRSDAQDQDKRESGDADRKGEDDKKQNDGKGTGRSKGKNNDGDNSKDNDKDNGKDNNRGDNKDNDNDNDKDEDDA